MANGDQPLGRQPARHDMLGRARHCSRTNGAQWLALCHGLRTAAAGISGATRHQHPELRGGEADQAAFRWTAAPPNVEPLGGILADPGHRTTAAGAEDGGRLDHPLDPGQVRRQMPAVARRLPRGLSARRTQGSLGLLLRRLEHALSQFGIFQRQIELVRRQLLGAFAELRALRGA